VTEITLHGARPAGAPRPRLGYAMVTAASALFAVNGSVSKIILTEGDISNLRLTELRATGAFLGLAAFVLATAPGRLRVVRDELPLLVFYGIVGFALVQWLYLVAIERLPIGIGLLLEFTAPVLVALWARLVWHEPVRRRVWAALALALSGLVLVGEVWEDVRLDTVGVVAGLLAAGALATYYLAGEH
jgi:drug/metabolite transporter (DMT)-like permease